MARIFIEVDARERKPHLGVEIPDSEWEAVYLMAKSAFGGTVAELMQALPVTIRLVPDKPEVVNGD